MTIIPDGYGQVNVRFGGAALPRGAEVTFGINFGVAAPTPEDAFDIIEPLLEPLHEAMAVTSVSIVGMLVKYGPNDEGPFFEGALAIPGNQATDAPPTQVAIGIKKISALGGRKNRGRMFWPGGPENNVATAGTWDSGALAQFDGALATFLAALDTAGIPMVILHNAVGTPTPVVALNVAARTYTQRRRNRP